MSTERHTLVSRRQFLALAGTAAAGSIVAACAPAPTPAPTAAPAEPTEAPTAVPTQAPEPTAVPPTEEPVALKYHFVAWGPMEDADLVSEAMSEYTRQEINASIELVPLDWAGLEEGIQLSLAAGEQVDLMFTCTWINNFYHNVSNGYLLPLDGLLPENAPILWKRLNDLDVWGGAKVGGKIYAAINGNIWAVVWGFCIRQDILDKYNWDPTTLKTYADYEPFCDAIMADYPETGILPTGWFDPTNHVIWRGTLWNLDDLGLQVGTTNYTGVHYDDPDLQAVFFAETPEYREAIEIARRWYERGYLPAEPTTHEDFVAQMTAGMYAMVPTNIAKPGREFEDKAKYGFDLYNARIEQGVPLMTTGWLAATMNAVAYTSVDPARAVQLIEMLNNNVEFYNLICKGIEGVHWVWVDESLKVIGFPEGVTPENARYNPNTDWMFGDQFKAYYVDIGQAEADVWGHTLALNEAAVISEAMGFAFVQDPVSTEIAQIGNAIAELGVPLTQGRVDPERQPELVDNLYAAGGEAFLAELQRQLDEFKASKA